MYCNTVWLCQHKKAAFSFFDMTLSLLSLSPSDDDAKAKNYYCGCCVKMLAFRHMMTYLCTCRLLKVQYLYTGVLKNTQYYIYMIY